MLTFRDILISHNATNSNFFGHPRLINAYNLNSTHPVCYASFLFGIWSLQSQAEMSSETFATALKWYSP